MNNFVPNCGISWKHCKLSGYLFDEIPTKTYFKTIRMNSFHYISLRLFNKLPCELRDNRSATLPQWKSLLDDYLSQVPDTSVVQDLTPGLCEPGTTKPSNSLLHWLPFLHITYRRGGYHNSNCNNEL